MRTYITAFMLVATLGLASCGGGNDVASSGATAVSAAASASNASPTSTPSTAATEPKVNGQIDERTGVAPVVAAMTPWSPTANGGCGNSWNYDGNGPPLNPPQQCACNNALKNATVTQCTALGGAWQQPWYCSISNATNPQKEQCLGGFWFSTPAYCAGPPYNGPPLYCN